MPPDQGREERLPPHNPEAERSVLGSMLRDNHVIADVVQIVRTENFYKDAHQKIFQGILTLFDRGHPADLVTLADLLKEQQQIEDVGGYSYLGGLWEAAPTAANAEYYARIVRDKAIVRNLIHASNEVLRDAYDQAMPADELLEDAERKILDIAQMGITGQTYTLKEALAEAYDRIDTRNQREALSVSGIPTGFIDLDDKTAGFQNSELIIIAARPSVGKCLAFDSEIVLADGSVTTIEEAYRRRRARLLTLHDNWRFGLTEPSAFIDDGVKPVYRVTTRLGRRVECTLAHPFRTLHGWQKLSELKPGDHIAIPRCVSLFGQEPLRECEVKLLAYLIGDGGLTGGTPDFTNGNPRLRADFAEAVARFGAVKVREENSRGTRTPSLQVAGDPQVIAAHRHEFATRLRAAMQSRARSARSVALALGVSPGSLCLWQQAECVPKQQTFHNLCRVLAVQPEDLACHGYAAMARNSQNALTCWLEQHGLWGKDAHRKCIPPVIFRLPRSQMALFLNRLFATDGWATGMTGGNPQVGFGTVSERLARQVQHLLLRFGIIASLRRRTVRSKGSRREAWQLEITDQQAIRTFLAEIGMFGKEAALTRREQALRGRNHQTNQGKRKKERGKSKPDHFFLFPSSFFLPTLSRRRPLQFATPLSDASLLELGTSEVYWDKIVSIESVGPKQVYDLTIPETHNFVANDICVHNTAFALNLVRHVVVEEDLPVFFVSLEQSRIELAERLLCCQARVDSHKLRKGHLSSEDMQKLIEAGGVLRNAKLFIDDTPGQGMLRIAANARRLKLRHDIKLVVLDYLQLIDPDNRRDSRQEQVAAISRRLKFLARELRIPVVSLAQVNRASEDRQDHRPRLADLRESGCLAGDTLVTLADTGARVPIRSLAGRSGFRVWALDEGTLKLKAAEVSRAFATGRKPLYRLETRLGRVIRATGNHQFRTLCGWQRLDMLKVGDRIALPRMIPAGCARSFSQAQARLLGHLLGDGCTLPRHTIQYTTRDLDLARTVADLCRQVFGDRIRPRIKWERRWYQVYLPSTARLSHGRRNPIAEWLDRLGAFGFRAWEKRVPDLVFQQSTKTIAPFLGHLWATDGCIKAPRGKTRYPNIYYATSSERLARDVQSLLLRLPINAVLRPSNQGGQGRLQFHVMVMGHDDNLHFAAMVGAVGDSRSSALKECAEWIGGREANTNRDVVPREIWRLYAVPAMERNGITIRQMQRALGMACMGTRLYKQNVSRERLTRLVPAVGGDERLAALAASDVYWDAVRWIEPDGKEEVYDLTVPGPANFVANEMFVHNSIEQDADTVMILHRPEMYEPGQQEGTVEVIIAKQRNGPIGEVTLTFLKQFMRFENFAVAGPFGFDG
jgi:replicative DNA helicase